MVLAVHAPRAEGDVGAVPAEPHDGRRAIGALGVARRVAPSGVVAVAGQQRVDRLGVRVAVLLAPLVALGDVPQGGVAARGDVLRVVAAAKRAASENEVRFLMQSQCKHDAPYPLQMFPTETPTVPFDA